MTDRVRKIYPDLSPVITISNNDLFIVEVVTGANTSNTHVVSANNLAKYISGHLKGPYANDAAANTAGVPVNSFYYDSTGTVKIRLT